MIITNEKYQPRFEAFIKHRQLRIGSEIPIYEFMIWILRKCGEFEKATKVKKPYSERDHEAFTQWLFDTAPQFHPSKDRGAFWFFFPEECQRTSAAYFDFEE